MKTFQVTIGATIGAIIMALFLAGCSGMSNGYDGRPPLPRPYPSMTLNGMNEVPPNLSTARGSHTVMVHDDGTVTGSVRVVGMNPTAAHIHLAPRGLNGPPIVTFVKIGANTFATAPGTRLTRTQYRAWLDGDLYINVHSNAYPDGEIRVQLLPTK